MASSLTLTKLGIFRLPKGTSLYVIQSMQAKKGGSLRSNAKVHLNPVRQGGPHWAELTPGPGRETAETRRAHTWPLFAQLCGMGWIFEDTQSGL